MGKGGGQYKRAKGKGAGGSDEVVRMATKKKRNDVSKKQECKDMIIFRVWDICVSEGTRDCEGAGAYLVWAFLLLFVCVIGRGVCFGVRALWGGRG